MKSPSKLLSEQRVAFFGTERRKELSLMRTAKQGDDKELS